MTEKVARRETQRRWRAELPAILQVEEMGSRMWMEHFDGGVDRVPDEWKKWSQTLVGASGRMPTMEPCRAIGLLLRRGGVTTGVSR